MKYLKKKAKTITLIIALILIYNLYFLLLEDIRVWYLLYIDLLVGILLGIILIVKMCQYNKKEKEKAEFLSVDDFIFDDLGDIENYDIIKHDYDVFQKLLAKQIAINHDQEDFISKWCHEVKIPLATASLMVDSIEDNNIKIQLKEQLEKIKQYLNSALVACKVQGTFEDLHVMKIYLLECINTSIKNNRYFLINNNFQININVTNNYIYSDSQWVIYILDQLIGNAIKYAKENPCLNIYTEGDEHSIKLYIKDNGEGIKDYELSRVFERGFVGSNHHNGQYKSTGMGLYMVKLMVDKLGHDIEVTSNYQEYTCFCITFKNNADYFNL